MNSKTIVERQPNLTDEQLLTAVAECRGLGTGDIARHLGYNSGGVLKHLKRLESTGHIERSFIQNGRLPVWRLADE